MTETEINPNTGDNKHRFGCLQVTVLLVIAIVVTVAVTLLVAKNYLFPSQFEPVTLNARESQALQAKLDNLEALNTGDRRATTQETKAEETTGDEYLGNGALKPEAYSETGAHREIRFSERELNALLAKNTDLAQKLAIDLSDELVSAKLLLPLDPDFPVMGGKTLRVRAGVGFAYENGRPVVILKGVTVMGVPIPNAWLGGIKNIDLVKEFGADQGFWKAFADGVESLKVSEGHLDVKLKE